MFKGLTILVKKYTQIIIPNNKLIIFYFYFNPLLLYILIILNIFKKPKKEKAKKILANISFPKSSKKKPNIKFLNIYQIYKFQFLDKLLIIKKNNRFKNNE